MVSADGSGDGEVEPDDNLRSFGETVKASRKRVGLTQEQLAPLIGYSVQYVGSVEQGRRHPSKKFIAKTESVLDTFGVIDIAARQLSRRRGLASWFRRWAELEEGAVILNTYECRSVPGLLQPESYARALIANVPPLATPEEADARVAARMERQKLLYRTPYILFSFIIEQALIERQTGGPEVTRELIDRLLEVGGCPTWTSRSCRRQAPNTRAPTARSAYWKPMNTSGWGTQRDSSRDR